MATDIQTLRPYLQNFDLIGLMVEGLGWNHHQSAPIAVIAGNESYDLHSVAEKAGFAAYRCSPKPDGTIPPQSARRQIENQVSQTNYEHLIIFVDATETRQVWQWVKRESNRPTAIRELRYDNGQTGTALLQRLRGIEFTLEEEGNLGITDVTGKFRQSMDVDRVTKRFYDQFRKELTDFQKFINGFSTQGDRDWYASLMLNRMMFVYFIQKQGFVDGDEHYLRNRLQKVQEQDGPDQFLRFYRQFLLRLFHEGLGQPERDRSDELNALLGKAPYLNGGIFDSHVLERDNPDINIPDAAFQQIFQFFDQYQWHLDDRPSGNDNEINPDILGYIFEKYVNQKQMGAYYTKEDITGYIARNTVIPRLLVMARSECPIAFSPDGGVWRLLQDDPDNYIYPAVGHGIAWDYTPEGIARLEQPLELPDYITRGLDDTAQRAGWNQVAPAEHALPTESWRELIARRQRYKEVRDKLAAGHVQSVNDLITLNLDSERFARDVIVDSEGPELVRAIWDALTNISVLDPACGSGAFLFAALNILEPLYSATMQAMRGFLADLETSKRPRPPKALQDFRNILDAAGQHRNERHYILKSIIVNNLYGVDIMEEAVEICRLRLFLKLAAQLETYDQIEPLPDIDFNIQAGNSLVGFTSLSAVRRSMTVSPDGKQFRILEEEQRKTLQRIEEDAEIANRAFNQFRWQQTMIGGEITTSHKADLTRRQESLRNELSRYLAAEHRVNVEDSKAYERWLASHQPFHWFVEFYGIMSTGGFDVVVANPPYVSTKSIEYSLANEESVSFPDIYGHVATRSRSIGNKQSRSGLIVPLSLVFSQDFARLRDDMAREGTHWCSSFDNIPAPLFSGTSQRCTIWISAPDSNQLFTTRLMRWRSAYRPCLIDNTSYVRVSDKLHIKDFGIPRLSVAEWEKFLQLPARSNNVQATLRRQRHSSRFKLSYSTVARNFLSTYLKPPPVIETDGSLSESAQRSSIALSSEADVFAALACTSGDACFWYWLTRADGFHVTNWLLTDFLTPIELFPADQLRLLSYVGQLLHRYRFAALVFKKNAGKFVGNYNYQKLTALTRRADLLYFSGLGATFREAQDILAFVAQVRSINESAGERGIPEQLKNQFPPPDVEALLTDKGILEVNERLCRLYGIEHTQLDPIIRA